MSALKMTAILVSVLLLSLLVPTGEVEASAGVQSIVSRIAAGEEMTVEECVRVALGSNPSLHSSRASVRATERAVLESYSTFMPTVDFFLDGSRTKQAGYTLYRPGIDEDKYSFFTSGIRLNQTLFTFSGIKGIQMARKNREAGFAGFEADRQELVYQVRVGCHTLLKMEDLLEVTRENLVVGQEQLKLAEKMKEVGAGVIADVLKAKAQVESNRLAVITAEKNMEVSRATLLTYLGLDVVLPLKIDRSRDAELEIPDYEKSLRSAVANRPDLKQMELTLAAGEDGVGAARGEHFPTLGGSFYYGWNYGKLNQDLYGEDKNNWRASISLNVPLFNVGTCSRVNQQKANLEAIRWNLETTRQNVAFDVRNAILSIEENVKKIDVAARNVTAAKEDLRVSQGKYKHGLVAILEMIQSQASLADARASRVESIYDYLSSRAALEKAIGKGF